MASTLKRPVVKCRHLVLWLQSHDKCFYEQLAFVESYMKAKHLL